MNKISYEQALNRLSVYCSRAERCVFDVRRKMDEWEIPTEKQNQIIQKLQKEKFIDDERYCRAFVNDKTLYNRWGFHKIRFELKRKQIPDSIISEALKNIDFEENHERLKLLIENKMKSVKGKNERDIRYKLMRFAFGRGFMKDDIEKILDSIPFRFT